MISLLAQLWSNDDGQDIAEYAVKLAVPHHCRRHNTTDRFLSLTLLFRRSLVQSSSALS